MRVFLLVMSLAFIAILSGCQSYSMPRSYVSTDLTLTTKDLTIGNTVKGHGTAWTILPPMGSVIAWAITGTAGTELRASLNATGDATMQAYERDGADFVFKPKSKKKYYWFVIFDYASSEVVARTAIINKTK